MIFYLAALQQLSPQLAEAAAIEGAGRWYFFPQDHLPAADADDALRPRQRHHHSFRLIDHIVVMTQGGPDNTTALLLSTSTKSALSSGIRPMRQP